MQEDEVANLLREIRDTQRELWKLAVEADARSKANLDEFARWRIGRRAAGFAVGVVLGLIVAMMAIQTFLMLPGPSDSKDGTSQVVHRADTGRGW
jgi:hypothetical protein